MGLTAQPMGELPVQQISLPGQSLRNHVDFTPVPLFFCHSVAVIKDPQAHFETAGGAETGVLAKCHMG